MTFFFSLFFERRKKFQKKFTKQTEKLLLTCYFVRVQVRYEIFPKKKPTEMCVVYGKGSMGDKNSCRLNENYPRVLHIHIFPVPAINLKIFELFFGNILCCVVFLNS